MATDADLVAAQLTHALDLLKAENTALRTELAHERESRTALASIVSDHETRLRALAESSTKFNFLVALATGGGFLGLITLIRTIVSP